MKSDCLTPNLFIGANLSICLNLTRFTQIDIKHMYLGPFKVILTLREDNNQVRSTKVHCTDIGPVFLIAKFSATANPYVRILFPMLKGKIKLVIVRTTMP